MLKFRHILKAFLAMSLFFIVGVGLASAAAPQGTLTGAQIIGVSDTGAASSTLTVVDFSTAEITAANDIRIKIPAGVYANWDVTDTAATIVNPVTGVVSGTVSFPDSKTLLLDVTTGLANDETVTISDLKIIGDAATAATALTWSIDGGATYGDATATITVTAADAAASVTLSAATPGATNTTTVTLTSPSALAATDTIVMVFPAQIDVSGVGSAVTGTFEAGGGNITCTAASQTVTCTTDGVITAATGTLILTGITSKYVGTTDLTSVTINDVASSSGADIALDTTVALTDSTVGALASTNVEPASLVAATYSNVTVTFTTNYQIPASGTIVVTFPSGFDVSNAAGQTPTSCTRMTCANWTATVSGQNVTLTENGTGATSAGATAFTLADIMTPGTTGSTGTYTILTTTGSANIDTNAAVTADTISGKTSSTPTIGDPSGLTITDAEDGNGVTLTWTDPSGDDSEYIYIYRGIDPYPVNGTSIASVAIGEETYTDTDVEAGDVVTYQIRGYASGTYGDMTEEVTFTVGSGETVTAPDTGDTEDTGDTSDTGDTEDTGDSDTGDTDSTEPVELVDVSGHWAEDSITILVDEGVITGDPDGNFRPDDSLNRAEASALLYRVLGLSDPSSPDSDPFDDVDMEAWYAGYVAELLSLGLVEGNPDGTYQPSENINRAEFLTLAMRVYVYVYGDMSDASTTSRYQDLDTSAWYEQTVSNATYEGFVGGSECGVGYCFNASSNITRAEAVTILDRMFYGGEVVDTSSTYNDSYDATTDTGDTSDDTSDDSSSTLTNAEAIADLTVTLQSYGDITVYNGTSQTVDLLGYYITDEHGYKYTMHSEIAPGESLDISPDDGDLTADDGSSTGYITLTVYTPEGDFVFSVNENLE